MTTKLLRSLAGRLGVTLALVFVVFAALCLALLLRSSRNYEKEVSQLMHKDLAAHIVEHYLLFKDGKPDLKAAENTFHELMILGPNFEFYLLDKDGNILAYSADPSLIHRQRIDTREFKQWRQTLEKQGYVDGDDPRSTSDKKIFSVAPILHDGQLSGYLYVVVGSQIRDALEQQLSSSRILQWCLTIFLLVFVFTLLVVMLVIGRITQPLALLTRQVREIRKKGFDKDGRALSENIENLNNWRPGSKNDIDELGHTFKLALETLQQQYTNVVSIDDLRKELLSHVSHDLRTPLASLLGYLETWELQKDGMTVDQGAEYVAIAKRNAQKIATLIEQLFELAHLDGNNVQVNLEPFPIAELIHDVLQKFSIQAKEKNIALSVVPFGSSICVRADVEKMDRVLTNLVENALRHTPENGSITVKIEPKSGFVTLQVSDTGIGIPEKDLPFIFDAHYKAGNSVRENTAHGGLGLAITKKLLELHESAIRVSSQLNQGTTFSFNLPIAG